MASITKLGLVAAALAGTSAAFAVPYTFVNWTSTTAGVITTPSGPINVTLSGPAFGRTMNYPSFTPASTFADGTIVGNIPDNKQLIQISQQGAFTLNFSQPVTNLAMCLWSVGGAGLSVTYDFGNQPFTLVSGGPNVEYGGQSLVKSGNTVSGTEGNGTIVFSNPLSSLSWNVIGAESYHGFTVGAPTVQAVPEPMTMGLGLAGVAAAIRRRRKRA